LSEPAFRRFAESAGNACHGHARSGGPASLDACAPRFKAVSFSASEISAIIDDVTHYPIFRHGNRRLFLVGSASFMTSDELLALAHAMAQAGTQLEWDRPIVVDKHCIGGIPGNRNLDDRGAESSPRTG